jgi:hypothetical protein
MQIERLAWFKLTLRGASNYSKELRSGKIGRIVERQGEETQLNSLVSQTTNTGST